MKLNWCKFEQDSEYKLRQKVEKELADLKKSFNSVVFQRDKAWRENADLKQLVGELLPLIRWMDSPMKKAISEQEWEEKTDAYNDLMDKAEQAIKE
jgi:hypothetical protein